MRDTKLALLYLKGVSGEGEASVIVLIFYS